MKLRERKLISDLWDLRVSSKVYRGERNPRNPWHRNHKPILGTITGRDDGQDSK